jgi:alpha-tubulin suppressor-like RCC1 family protein
MIIAALLLVQGAVQPATPDSLRFVALSAGGTHTCALTTGGLAYCWGGNRWGQLGNGEVEPLPASAPFEGMEAYDTTGSLRVRLPQRVGVPARLVAISAGNQHSCALGAEGEVYCWGFGRFGQLGHGAFSDSPRPVRVASQQHFRAISAGATHTCAIAIDGSLFCWGGNWHGQLGDSSLTNRAKPTPVARRSRFGSVAAGGIHSCAIDTAGIAWCWGSQSLGRLGLSPPPAMDQLSPARVVGTTRFRSIAAWVQTCAISRSGEVYCWGLGAQDVVGSGVGASAGPRRIPLDAPATQLDVGPESACIVAESTDLLCWEISNSLTGPQNAVSRSPLPRALGTGVRWFSAGGNDFINHACTLGAQSEPRCWGNDAWAQLGEWRSPMPRP